MMSLISLLDPKVIPFAVSLCVLGKWLKKLKLPKWMPPLPLLLVVSGFLMMTVYGYVTSGMHGASEVVYALLYGLANGIAVSATAMVGYDIGHSGAKKHRENVAAEKAKAKAEGGEAVGSSGVVEAEVNVDVSEVIRCVSSSPSLKISLMKVLLYVGAAAIGAVTAVLVAVFAAHQSAVVSTLWGLFGAGLFASITRVVYHIAMDDSTPQMWQISVYHLLACFGWMFGILSGSEATDTIALAVVISMALMSVGTRFLSLPSTQKELLETLEKNLRWKFLDDNPAMGIDEGRPLGLTDSDGIPMTVHEMESLGKAEEALTARAYIHACLGIADDGKQKKSEGAGKASEDTTSKEGE